MTGTNKDKGNILDGIKDLLGNQEDAKKTTTTAKKTTSSASSKTVKPAAKKTVKKAGDGVTKTAKASLDAYNKSKGKSVEKQLEVLHSKTHQDLINAAYKAAEELGIAPWVLLRAAGWGHFTDDRGKKYDGAAIDELEGLDDAQKAALKKVLDL